MTMIECNRNLLCIDCNDTECWHQGKKESDCPEYRCDKSLDCNKCAFIDQYIDDMRKMAKEKIL